ncbi:MAG: gluconate 2-dehydrogenase subunit 3 family protein [Bacteroidetes bacterium]|nr:gluconate 2-dehydrogenase subunit 3 family protein [Bacteroidota bacterium]MCY4204373.1 gluconate 2-dehydrogenase subunit 3 family protein [Bacteroidota bacterium]
MDRRAALQRISLLIGGTVSASTVAGILGGCGTGTNGGAFNARTLTQGRDELVATLSELIIPETDTPGARTAKVHEFIDNMLTDWSEEGETEEFLSGLEDVEKRARAYGEDSFLDLNLGSQVEILTQMEAETLEGEDDNSSSNFFETIKTLTIYGYYTSEVGATQELHLNPMGVYKPDIPFSEVGRTWA